MKLVAVVVASMLGGCTVVGAGTGLLHANVHNHGSDVSPGNRASVGKEMLAGAVIGLMVDLAVWQIAKGFKSVE